MTLYPNIYVKNVLEIDEKIIEKNEIKALLLDVDNTLLNYDKVMLKRNG